MLSGLYLGCKMLEISEINDVHRKLFTFCLESSLQDNPWVNESPLKPLLDSVIKAMKREDDGGQGLDLTAIDLDEEIIKKIEQAREQMQSSFWQSLFEGKTLNFSYE